MRACIWKLNSYEQGCSDVRKQVLHNIVTLVCTTLATNVVFVMLIMSLSILVVRSVCHILARNALHWLDRNTCHLVIDDDYAIGLSQPKLGLQGREG
jgi:hypothetical protein